MLEKTELRAMLFAVHGAVALGCGLAVLYLSLLAANPFFSAVAVVIALVLCGAAITLSGIADWFAAAEAERRNWRQILLYSLAGLCLIAAGSFLGFSATATIEILLLLVIAHGLLFGLLGIVSAFHLDSGSIEAVIVGLFGFLSIGIAAWAMGHIHSWNDRTALLWVGGYLCIVGAKLFFFAGERRYHALMPGRSASSKVAGK